MKRSHSGPYFLIASVCIVLFLGFVLATAPVWIAGSHTVNYTTQEDSVYYHDFSSNITGYNNDVTFAINTIDNNITWINSSGTYEFSSTSVISDFIRIMNSSTGNMTVNATFGNQTGFFTIPIQATNTSVGGGAVTEDFEFIINDTNDAPNLTGMNNTYNTTQDEEFFEFLNATDEEGHYPLIFNVTFNSTNCTHAAWAKSYYPDNTNCSLDDFGFVLTSVDNVSASMNFTANRSHVGIYWANISVKDAGENYDCNYPYCDNSTYKTNKTYYYTDWVKFNVLASLYINTTDCDNKIFNESFTDTCTINITTKGATDDLNLSTYAILRNYAAGQSSVTNTSWFYPNASVTAAANQYEVTINLTPTKTEIGNWTINFTAVDSNGDNSTAQIYVLVNRTSNDVPDLKVNLSNVPSNTTSIDLPTTINFSVYDDDMLVPDKNSSYGGFNETHVFTYTVYNATTMTEFTLSSSSSGILAMPVSETNRTNSYFTFTPNNTETGIFTFNVSVNDSEGVVDFSAFNITVVSNSAPQWNLDNTTLVYDEGDEVYLNLTQNVTDADLDALTFSFTNTTPVGAFTINSSTGAINITFDDPEIGDHLINVTVSDGYLTNSTIINFTIYNSNDNPSIVSTIDGVNVTPTSITSGLQVNGTEDNYTTITLWVDDDDFKIPSEERTVFYNESLNVSVTITGNNTNLFSFTRDPSWPTTSSPARSKYEAIFTPNKTDVGNHTINISVTDYTGSTDTFIFYLDIIATNHNPSMSTLFNQSSAVNRTFYYDVNATDTEEGNDTFGVNYNFNFSYTNLSGTNIFSSFFNKTTGIFNITLNSSHEGLYHLNVTVNDSDGFIDYDDFWISIYSTPSLTYPTEGITFNLTENTTSVLNFTVDHGVDDNLTYVFYTDFLTCPYNSTSSCNYSSDVLRYNSSYYGNSSSINWSFSPNFTDETYGLLKNLTLVVYPASSSLTNSTFLNSTFGFKLNVTHTNANVTFYDNFDDQTGTVGTNLEINLYNHFSDADHSDSYYAESLSFTPSINTSSITSSVSSGGVLTLAATSSVVGGVNVTGADDNSSGISNNFVVVFNNPSTTTVQSSGGGGTKTVPVSLKLLLPDPVSAYLEDYIELPISLYNDGEQILRGITLGGSAAKDGGLISDIGVSFSQDTFDVIGIGETVNLTMFVDLDVTQAGNYEINVNASVTSPSYVDWGKMYITVQEGENFEEKVVFTEEFIVDNPECLELLELVNEAKALADQGRASEAIQKSEEAISACRDLIAQSSNPISRTLKESPLYRYLVIATVSVFILGIIFYSYKRIRMKRLKGSFIQESIKNKKYFE